MIKLYMLDTHFLFMEMLDFYFKSNDDFNVIGFSNNKNDFLKLLDSRSKRPDILVIDFSTNKNGLDLSIIQELKRRRFQTKILALSSDINLHLFSELIKLNIDGLLLKDCRIDTFVHALYTLYDNKKYIYPSIVPLLNSYMIADDFESKKVDDLTLREKEVLKLISKGFTNKEISFELGISERTVKNHIFSIFKKIDCTDRTQATLFVVRNHLFTD